MPTPAHNASNIAGAASSLSKPKPRTAMPTARSLYGLANFCKKHVSSPGTSSPAAPPSQLLNVALVSVTSSIRLRTVAADLGTAEESSASRTTNCRLSCNKLWASGWAPGGCGSLRQELASATGKSVSTVAAAKTRLPHAAGIAM
eukprot:CAMPEP_0171065486 /NCGR_PEP_ID=MMETSP0766_2-20121228/6873_1 /TAXON_ID=439317 /ORGANISM="Gambierdiscus australes, Strain CAWD 149" /LENGTH=144 /DNA_ID=CAMNT_0011521591 /DNA_START=99 /DNA_END=533 /DNA_ORIENTATION=+